MIVIRCENLHKSFGAGAAKTAAIRGITASFESGKFYSVIGKSGSGKSTLLYLLSGILSPDQGEVYYGETALSSTGKNELEKIRRQQVGVIFQDYQLLPELTVKENILLPQVLDHREPDHEWCSQILERLEIADIACKYPNELSGGQQQRVAIARAIMNRPAFLFADEPTGNLDKKTSESVLNFLMEVRGLYHPMILLVTHDLDIARSADTILHIEDGKLVAASEEAV